MPLATSILSKARLHRVSLQFIHPRLEAHFQRYQYPTLLKHVRLALLLGALMYEMYGILDFLLVSKPLLPQITFIRLGSTILILLVFAVSFLKAFQKHYPLLLTTLLALSALSLVFKMQLVDARIFPYYFSALLLLIFWIHAFGIHSFINVLKSTMIIVLITLTGLFLLPNFSVNEKIGYVFILLSAVAITNFASYVSEKQARALFLREKIIDRERYTQKQLALHDFLTGLPNRALLLDHIRQAIIESKRNEQLCAGYFIDLDDFKMVNDKYSHAVGDAVLVQVAERLKMELRAMDTVARISGDEFFVLARDIKNNAQAMSLGHKLLAVIKAPYVLSTISIQHQLSASIGVCVFPYLNVNHTDVLDRADKAMYAIKLSQKSGVKLAEVVLP